MKIRVYACLLLGLSFIADVSAGEITEFATHNPEIVEVGSDVYIVTGVQAGSAELELYVVREGTYGFITRAEVLSGSAEDIDLDLARAEFDLPIIVLSDIVVDGTSYYGVMRYSPSENDDDRDLSREVSSAPPLALDFERIYINEMPLPAEVEPEQVVIGTEDKPPEPDLPGEFVETPVEGYDSIETNGGVQSSNRERQDEVRKLSERVDILETYGVEALQELEERITTVETLSSGVSSNVEDLTRRGVEEAQLLSSQIEFLATTFAELKRSTDQSGESGNIAVEQPDVPPETGDDLLSLSDARRSLQDVLKDSFLGGESILGEWEVHPRRAIQSDGDSFFAKLRLPVEQATTSPILYSLDILSQDEGWVGAGLHLFTSGVNRERGYGHGQSILIWLTRDPDVYGSSRTYLQLYRSTGDVEMERIAHVALPERIEDGLLLEVLMDPRTNHITVATNGEERFRYFVFFPLAEGVEVALRSLGRARFENLLVLGSM